MRRARLCALTALVAASTPALAQAAASLEVRAVVKGTQLGIPWTVVTLDAAPADGTPEAQQTTDGRGIATFSGLAAGDYHLEAHHPAFQEAVADLTLADNAQRKETVELTQVASGKFQLALRASDVRSHAGLPGATFTIERFDDPMGLGAPAWSRTLPGDAYGQATFVGLVPGYYRITAQRLGWQTLVEPAVGARELRRSSSAELVLKPNGRRLRVEVKGFEPVTENVNGWLKDAWVELAALDFTSDRVVIPARSARTNGNGWVDFHDLAAMRWKVTVKKHGYKPASTIFYCTAQQLASPQTCDTHIIDTSGVYSYDGWHRSLNLTFEPSTVRLKLDSMFVYPVVKYSTVRLEGLKGTPTEGVERFGVVMNDPTDGPLATFAAVPPGRFQLRATTNSAMGPGWDVAGNPGVLGTGAFSSMARVTTLPWTKLIEVPQGVTVTETAALQTRLVTVRGRILGVDALVPDVSLGYSDRPVYAPKTSSSVTFKVHYSLAALRAGQPTSYTVATDANGFFTASLPPGLYGVQVPDLTDYTGHQLRVRARSPVAGLAYDWRDHPWPYPDLWPHAGSIDTFHAPWISLSSGAEYDVDLVVRRQFIDLVGSVDVTNESFSAVTATSSGVEADVRDLALGTAVTVTGAQGRSVPVQEDFNAGLRYQVTGLRAGTYSVNVDHPRYTAGSPIPVTVPLWGKPGFAPAEDPQVSLFPLAGWRYELQHPTTFQRLEASNVVTVDSSPPYAQVRDWYDPQDGNPAYYLPETVINSVFYVEMPHRPGDLFRAGGQPDAACQMHIALDDQGTWKWASRPCRSDRQYVFYRGGGPSDDFPSSTASPFVSSVPLEVRTLLGDGAELPGLVLELVDASQVTSGTTTSSQASGVGATMVTPGWAILSTACRYESSPRAMKCDYRVERRMAVSGAVTLPGGGPAADVVVRVLDRFGQELAWTRTDNTGAFALAGYEQPQAQAVWLDVQAPGYYPVRKRFDPSLATPDVTGAALPLTQLPSPTISAFEFDRYGLFLPLVTRSGDSTGYNAQNALPDLTLTARVDAAAQPFSYTVDSFAPDGGPSTPEQLTRPDAVVDFYVVDKRLFPSRATNEVAAQPELTAADLQDPAALQKFLAEAAVGQRGGQPLQALVVRGASEGADAGYAAQVSLPNLPPGVFDPFAVVVTEQGAVAVADYTPPAGKPALEGVGLPQWAQTFTDVLGFIVNYKPDMDVGDLVPQGKFRPQPDFSADIDVNPNGTMTYNYALGVAATEGTPAPGSGLLGLGNRFIGLQLGGRIGFKLDGATQKASLYGQLELTQQLVKDRKLYLFGAIVDDPPSWRTVALESLEVTGSGTVALKQTLGQGHFPVMEGTVKTQGFLGVDVGVNLGPLTRLIPYVGPVLFALDHAGGLQVLGIIRTGGGGAFETIWRTSYTPTGGSTTGQVEQEFAFGQIETTAQPTVLWRAGAGLAVKVGGGAVNGSVVFQIGAPANKPGPGAAVTFTEGLKWPVVSRVEAAASIIAQFQVKVAGLGVGRKLQWDLKRVDWQFGSEPYADLADDNDEFQVWLPSSAAPAAWVGTGQGGPLVTGLYPPSGTGVTSGAGGGAVAFVQTQAGTHVTNVGVSVLGSSGWSAPVFVTGTGTVLAAAALTRADGSTLVVLSELDATELGSPRAKGRLSWALVPQGATGPITTQVLAQNTGAVEELFLVRAGDGAVAAWVDGVDALGGGAATVRAAAFDGAWSAPVALAAAGRAKARALAGHPSQRRAALAQVKQDGALEVLDFDGTAWSAAAVSASGLAAVDAAFAADGALWLLESAEGVGLSLRQRDAAGTWQAPLSLASLGGSTGLARLLPLADGTRQLLLVGWLQADQTGLFRYAFVEPSGAIAEGPRTGWSLPGDVLGALSLLPDPAEKLAARAVIRRANAGADSLLEQRLVFGQAPVDPGGVDGGAGGGAGGGDAGGAGGGEGQGGGDAGPGTAKPCGCAAAGEVPLAALMLLALRRRRSRPAGTGPAPLGARGG